MWAVDNRPHHLPTGYAHQTPLFRSTSRTDLSAPRAGIVCFVFPWPYVVFIADQFL